MTEHQDHGPQASVLAFLRNRLVLAMAGITVLYWSAFYIAGVPGFVLIQTATLVLMFMLLGVMWKWALPTIADLAQGRSSGSTQLMLGILIWAISSEVVLGWTFAWRYLDNPEWMVDHPILGFARMWSAVGAALMITSAGARTGPITPASWIWISIASCLGGIVAGMLIMSSFQTPHVALDGNAVYREGRFICTQSWPVVVSSSGVYHTMDSPFRAMVEKPVACFTSVEEAREAGFRAPG